MTSSNAAKVPLWRNRDFVLLQAGQLLSNAGSESTRIAYPLLVLATTGSAAEAGVVSFARLLPSALFGLPAGVVADRYDRRRVMIAADAVRGVAIAGLAAMILAGRLAFWQIALVGFVEGAGVTFFAPAAAGALRGATSREQLPAAAGAVEARTASVMLAGPPLGGALFQLARAAPFLVDAASYVCSMASLVLIRTPFQEPREIDPASVRSQIAEGFGFLWRQPFLRACAILFGLTNIIGPGVLLAVVVIGARQGLSSGAIGALFAAFGGCMLVGSIISPLFRRALSVRVILLLELWTWIGCGVFLVWPSVYALTAGILPAAIAIPITNSVVTGYRVAITPDRLLGRVESVRSVISLLLAPLGPLAAGLLLSSTSERATIAAFAALGLALALWGSLSPSIRNAPALADLDN